MGVRIWISNKFLGAAGPDHTLRITALEKSLWKVKLQMNIMWVAWWASIIKLQSLIVSIFQRKMYIKVPTLSDKWSSPGHSSKTGHSPQKLGRGISLGPTFRFWELSQPSTIHLVRCIDLTCFVLLCFLKATQSLVCFILRRLPPLNLQSTHYLAPSSLSFS